MRTFVLILLPAAALVVWAIVEERKLRAMDSGAGKAMQQVGVRLAACLDAVAALLDLTWDYTARQAPQAETVRSGQGVIVSASQAADVTAQEALALDALRYVETVAVQYPALRSDAAYIRAMAAIDCGRQILRSSHQQYNDAAERFNAALRRMPARLIGRLTVFPEKRSVKTNEYFVYSGFSPQSSSAIRYSRAYGEFSEGPFVKGKLWTP